MILIDRMYRPHVQEPGGTMCAVAAVGPKGGGTTPGLSTEHCEELALRIARPTGARDRVPALASNTCRGTLRTVRTALTEALPRYQSAAGA